MSINFNHFRVKFAELFSAVFQEVNYRNSAKRHLWPTRSAYVEGTCTVTTELAPRWHNEPMSLHNAPRPILESLHCRIYIDDRLK